MSRLDEIIGRIDNLEKKEPLAEQKSEGELDENKEESLSLQEQGKIDAAADEVIDTQLKGFEQKSQSVKNSSIITFSNSAIQSVMKIAEQIKSWVSSQIPLMVKTFQTVVLPLQYIHLLEELKWPLFLVDNEQLKQDILAACEDGVNEEEVKRIVLNFCTNDFLDEMKVDWEKCDVLLDDRKIVLAEALLMHKLGYYYASTSMLMCQVYGVASDINKLARKEQLIVDQEMKEMVADYYKIDKADIDKEKGKIMQMSMMTESGMFLWDAMAHYLQNEILSSSESKKRWETQPSRNKICHGAQLNFGTQEHSIKAILTVDMLIQLAYELKYLCERKRDSKNT